MDDMARRDRRGAGRRRFAAWLPVLAWAGLIFAFSAHPNLRFLSDASLDFLVRKAGHMGVYGILALLLWRALATTTAWRRPWPWSVVLAILYAITDEFHQGFVAGRHESAADVGIDAAVPGYRRPGRRTRSVPTNVRWAVSMPRPSG
jgi:VanZ family protein